MSDPERWINYQEALRRYYIESGMAAEEASQRALAEVRNEMSRRDGGKSIPRRRNFIRKTLLGRWRVEDADGNWRATFRDQGDAVAFIEFAPELSPKQEDCNG